MRALGLLECGLTAAMTTGVRVQEDTPFDPNRRGWPANGFLTSVRQAAHKCGSRETLTVRPPFNNIESEP